MKNTKALTVVAVSLAAILLLAQNVMAEAAVDQAMRQTAALRAQELARELQIERQEQRQMADLLFQQALPLIEQGEYRKAHTLLSEALRRCPNHTDSKVKIGEVNSVLYDYYTSVANDRLQMRDYESAINFYRQALEHKQGDEALKGINKARKLLEAAASQQLSKIVNTDLSEEEQVYQMIKQAEEKVVYGQYEEAKSILKQAIKLESEDPRPRRMLRDVIAKQNKLIKSDQELERSQIMLEVLRKISPEAAEDTEEVGSESTDAPGESARKAMWAKLMNKIPAVSLDNNTVSEAVQFLIEEGNIPIVLDAAGVNDKISLDAEGPTILTVIEYICDTANLNYIVTGPAVIISKGEGQMETRIWTVSPGVVSKASEIETDDSSSDAFGGIFDTDTGSDEDFSAMETEPELVRALKDYIGAEVEGSSIFLEPVSGTLVARNTVKNLELIDSYLKNLDESGDQVQVEIQARFVEISDQDLNEISFGMKLKSPWKVISAHNNNGNAIVANPTDFTGALRRYSKGSRNSRYADRLSSVMSMVGVGAIGKNQINDEVLGFFTNALTDPEVGLIFNAIDNKTNADVLSAPSVTTVSGQPRVTIKQITEVMYPEDYTVYKPAIIYSNAQSFSLLNPSSTPDVSAMPGYATVESTLKEDVGIELQVSPIVADDKRTVSMDITCKTSSEIEPRVVSVYVGNSALNVDPIELDIPRFKFSEVKTQVVVADGETVVLGGMVTETLRQYKDKVPFLGDLPLIGRFFRAEGSYNEKKHLLIFVKTNIITPTGELYRDRVASKLASSLEQERADYEEGEQVTEAEEGEEESSEVEDSTESEETTEVSEASDEEATEETSEETSEDEEEESTEE
ncbi:hypothetical protein IKS73_01430 [bacterium]|nr:hypothetical protein [bacterium]